MPLLVPVTNAIAIAASQLKRAYSGNTGISGPEHTMERQIRPIPDPPHKQSPLFYLSKKTGLRLAAVAVTTPHAFTHRNIGPDCRTASHRSWHSPDRAGRPRRLGRPQRGRQ